MEYEVIRNFLSEYTVEITGLSLVLAIVPLVRTWLLNFSPQIGYVDVGVVSSSISKYVENDFFMSYKGKKTSQIKVQFFTIFNNKKVALLKEDLRESPFVIYVENGFLDVEIIGHLKNEGDIQLKKISDQKYFIEFKYINPKDAFTVRVVYNKKEPILCLKAINLDKFEHRVNLLTDKYSRYSWTFEMCMLFLCTITTNQLSHYEEFNKFSFNSFWNNEDTALILEYMRFLCGGLFGLSMISIIIYGFLKGAPHWVWKFFKKTLKPTSIPLIQESKYHDDL